MNISPVIIVKNASKTIAQTLESLKEFDDVVVYDTGSNDNTLEIAGKFPNVKLCKGRFSGFGNSRNNAALMAKNDWIFAIDADEVVSPALMNSIKKLQIDPTFVYKIKRYNYYRKRRVRFSGWSQEIIIRLYNKTVIRFNEKLVHEHIDIVDSKTVTLKGELRHYSYSSISEFIQKRNLYSDLFATENTGKRKSSPFIAFIKGTFDFVNTYFRKLGFLDGYRGLLIAVSNADVTFYKYLKLYEMNSGNDKKVSLIISTYNWSEALKLTLKSAINQSIPPDEIIIADDGSGNDTRKAVEEFAESSFIPIVHSWQEDNGFRVAKSRNLAITKSNCNYLVFVDGDVILHKHFIADHINASKNGCFVQGTRVLMDDSLSNSLLGGRIKRLPSFFSKRYRNKINSLSIPIISGLFQVRNKNRKGISSCNFSLFKEDLIRVNGFNEAFEGWGKEDAELVERLYNAGLHRRNLRFSGIQYHLNHLYREPNAKNYEILDRTIKEKFKWCDKGLDKYLIGSKLGF